MQSKEHTSSEWSRVLSRVEQALGQAVTRLKERERDLRAKDVVPARSFNSQIDGFDERLATLATGKVSSQQSLAASDGDLRDCEETLSDWLTRAEAARRRLADHEGKEKV